MEKVNAVLTQLASAFDTINAPKSKISKHSLMQDKINKYTKNDSIEISHSSESSSPFKIVRPWNYSDYKYRVMTFSKTANWFAKPSIISPLVCARFGWVNHSADLLYCHVCSKSIRHDESVDSSGELLASSLQSSHDIACQWWECSCPQTFESFPDQASTELRADFLGRLVNVSRSLLEVSRVKPTDTFVVTLPTALGQLPTAERLLGRDASIQLSFSVAGAVLSAICQALSSGSCDASNTAMVSFPTASIFISGSSEEAAVHRDLINLQAKLIEYLCVHLGMQVSEEAVSSIVRVCILLALFGWSKAPSDLPTDLAPSSNSSSSKTQEQPSVLASMDGKLCCGICGRWVDLLYFCCDSSISSVSAGSNISRVFDPLSQHKSYCPWIATSGNELSCGWQVCVQQLLSTAGQSNEQSRKRVRLSSGNDETYVSTNEDVNTSIEPADVYQRIKAVLDIASSTTLSRK